MELHRDMGYDGMAISWGVFMMGIWYFLAALGISLFSFMHGYGNKPPTSHTRTHTHTHTNL